MKSTLFFDLLLLMAAGLLGCGDGWGGDEWGGDEWGGDEWGGDGWGTMDGEVMDSCSYIFDYYYQPYFQ